MIYESWRNKTILFFSYTCYVLSKFFKLQDVFISEKVYTGEVIQVSWTHEEQLKSPMLAYIVAGTDFRI